MKSNAIRRLFAVFAVLLALGAAACGEVIGKDERSDLPEYRYSAGGELLSFTLELRERGDRKERADGDAFLHSSTDGEIIYIWSVPFYGDTVYEAITKFFDGRQDDVTFTLSEHRFYMFKNCTLENGSVYDLSTVYVDADGTYSKTANFQPLAGKDGVFGTDDDLKKLTLVYRGWLNE